MNDLDFTADRAAAIRAALIDHVAEQPTPRRRRSLWATAFILIGMLIGAGGAGAFAASGVLSPSHPAGEPAPAYRDAVPAPAGVVPGSPLISELGRPLTVALNGASDVSVPAKPTGATHLRVTITPSSPGSVTFGLDPSGNNPTSTATKQAIQDGRAVTWYDFPVDHAAKTLYLRATGMGGFATMQWLLYVPTRLAVNQDGQTYGVSGSIAGEPDLVYVTGTTTGGTPIDGYARQTDLNAFSPDHPGRPANPTHALQWQQERDQKYPHGWTVPIYKPDGHTQIGVFQIGR